MKRNTSMLLLEHLFTIFIEQGMNKSTSHSYETSCPSIISKKAWILHFQPLSEHYFFYQRIPCAIPCKNTPWSICCVVVGRVWVINNKRVRDLHDPVLTSQKTCMYVWSGCITAWFLCHHLVQYSYVYEICTGKILCFENYRFV